MKKRERARELRETSSSTQLSLFLVFFRRFFLFLFYGRHFYVSFSFAVNARAIKRELT